HLAGCDECTDLLVTLGVGLEDMALEAPELLAHLAPRPVAGPRRRPSWLMVVVGTVCAAAAAAA
ncbi:MAG: hypothetical protein KC549_05140, partial [Myxococcales bacterium]|nr:hypothetical protein [Myxococcales bacterium]